MALSTGWLYVTESKSVYAMRYHHDEDLLDVQFVQRGAVHDGTFYRYQNIGPAQWQVLYESKHPGKDIQVIKSDTRAYPFTKHMDEQTVTFTAGGSVRDDEALRGVTLEDTLKKSIETETRKPRFKFK